MITPAPLILSAEGIQQRQFLPEEESIAIKRAVNCEGKRAPSHARLSPLPTAKDFSRRLLSLPMHGCLSGAEVDRAITTVMSTCA